MKFFLEDIDFQGSSPQINPQYAVSLRIVITSHSPLTFFYIKINAINQIPQPIFPGPLHVDFLHLLILPSGSHPQVWSKKHCNNLIHYNLI